MYLKNNNIHILNKYFPNDISNIINSYSYISLLEWDKYIHTYFFFKKFNHKYINPNYLRFRQQKYALHDYAGNITRVCIFLNNIDKTYTSKISIEHRDYYILYYLEKHKYVDIEELFADITKYLNFLNNSNRIQKLFHFYKIPKRNFEKNGKCDIMKKITKNILKDNIIISAYDKLLNYILIKNEVKSKTRMCIFMSGVLLCFTLPSILEQYGIIWIIPITPLIIFDILEIATFLMKKIATYL